MVEKLKDLFKRHLTFILVFASLFITWNLVFAQEEPGMIPQLSIGGYAVPFLLTIIMGLIYRFVPVIADQYKALVTIVVALLLAFLAAVYEPPEAGYTAKLIIETFIGGLMIGCQAIGIYEGARSFYRPRK